MLTMRCFDHRSSPSWSFSPSVLFTTDLKQRCHLILYLNFIQWGWGLPQSLGKDVSSTLQVKSLEREQFTALPLTPCLPPTSAWDSTQLPLDLKAKIKPRSAKNYQKLEKKKVSLSEVSCGSKPVLFLRW